MLNILNSSWLSSWCPQCRRSMYVSTFLKKGEGPSRRGKLPLNSADFDDRDGLGKIHCLSWWLEEHSALGPWQAGFRKGRIPPTSACGCHNLSFMDFSQPSADAPLLPYSTLVRRAGLLIKMSKMGVPCHFTEWLSSWFINRTARV